MGPLKHFKTKRLFIAKWLLIYLQRKVKCLSYLINFLRDLVKFNSQKDSSIDVMIPMMLWFPSSSMFVLMINDNFTSSSSENHQHCVSTGSGNRDRKLLPVWQLTVIISRLRYTNSHTHWTSLEMPKLPKTREKMLKHFFSDYWLHPDRLHGLGDGNQRHCS